MPRELFPVDTIAVIMSADLFEQIPGRVCLELGQAGVHLLPDDQKVVMGHMGGAEIQKLIPVGVEMDSPAFKYMISRLRKIKSEELSLNGIPLDWRWYPGDGNRFQQERKD